MTNLPVCLSNVSVSECEYVCLFDDVCKAFFFVEGNVKRGELPIKICTFNIFWLERGQHIKLYRKAKHVL